VVSAIEVDAARPRLVATAAFATVTLARPTSKAGVLVLGHTPPHAIRGGEPSGGDQMPKYIIERNIPGAGKLSPGDLKAISQKSCNVLRAMGPQIQWVHSYVTDDKIYCVYVAPDEAAVREHARQGGFPANSIARVHTVIEPVTSEA
jgi:hypothetical protein